jgi:uncharacterized protein (DUF885 family)
MKRLEASSMCADVRSRVDDLADRYWQAYVEAHPVAATSFGDARFDDRMDDLRRSAALAHRARLEALREEAVQDADKADAADRPTGADDAVTLAALISQIDGDLAEVDADLGAWTVDPIEGPQLVIFNIEAFQPADTVAEGRALVDRWRAMGAFLDQHRANLRQSLAEGRVAVRTPTAHVIDAVNGVLAEPDDAWALLNPARVDHPEWPAEAVRTFRADLASAVADVIRPALVRLRDTLRDEILPATRDDDRPGILHVSGGPDAYRRLVRSHTSLDVTPDALHQVGLEEVARINGELEALGRTVLGTGDRPEILARLRGDPALHFRTPDEVAAQASAALERASAAIPGWFGVLPHNECVVVRMGQHEAGYGTIAYYRPSPDGVRPGTYYINTTEPETRPRYEAEALAYHESIPGHHLQIAIAQEVVGLPMFRRHLGVTAFWEGWALYTERLADEMGLYSGDLDRIGILSFDAWRACRLVVDTGMHAQGWTRQQAIDYMLANSALAPNNIANEVDRYITWPGQALAYKAGQLELLRLRADLRTRLGPAFDIRAFHDAVLRHGAIGLVPLRDLVERELLGA